MSYRIRKDCVSHNQGAFLEGRWIAENIKIAHEVLHKVKKHRSDNGLMVIKINLKKAYDHLEWGFLEGVLGSWGFSTKV